MSFRNKHRPIIFFTCEAVSEDTMLEVVMTESGLFSSCGWWWGLVWIKGGKRWWWPLLKVVKSASEDKSEENRCEFGLWLCCCCTVVGGCHWKWTWLFTAAGLDGNEACLPWKFFFKEFAEVDEVVDDDDVEVVLTSMASKGGLEAIVL